MAKDIVCEAVVDEKTCDWVTEYKGKKYYFDVAGCQTTFEMNQEHFMSHPHS